MKLHLCSLVLGLVALGSLGTQTAKADRYADYWLPENMAKRQCTSVHLGYGPAIPSHSAAYTEAVVEKSAPGSYFAIDNFSNGYIGIQEIPGAEGQPSKRVAIFSVWDAKDSGDNPHAAPEEERAKLIQRGEYVRTDRFGGEGTGGKSMRLFPWKEGEPVRALVVEKEDGPDFRQVAGYIYNPASSRWELMSCWRVQALSRGLGGGCGFVEDFRRNVESKQHERRATFGPALRWDGKQWQPATRFRFTKDGNPNPEINCRFNPQRGYFSLATGGDIKAEEDFPVSSERELPIAPKAAEPMDAAAVMEIINAPKLEAKEYSDNGSME